MLRCELKLYFLCNKCFRYGVNVSRYLFWQTKDSDTAVTLMPSIFKFPLEIEEKILNILAEDDEGHSELKICSLVCQAFLPICRKHIFENIVLNGYDLDLACSATTLAFERLLRETPEIADYIRKLDYSIRKTDLTSPSIQESLKRINRLEFLTFQNWESLNWSNNPIRPALLHLLHLPTLSHFKATSIKDFFVSDLIPCVNLKYLEIGIKTSASAENTFPATLPHPIQLEEFVAQSGSGDVIMKLCTARRPDGQPIIDFWSLSKITVGIEVSDDIEASQELIRRCDNLTNVHITCKCYLHFDYQDFYRSLLYSPETTNCQTQPRRHAAAIDADSEAHCREYQC